MDNLWLDEGYHSSLHIEHHRATLGAGPFTGGGWKLAWHITVSPWEAVDAMVETVVAKQAEPHFVIGGRPGREHPTVLQLLPLNVAGRSLQHTFAPQTNRANVIQVEICAWDTDGPKRKPEDVIAGWPVERYKALANLTALIDQRAPIPRRLARRFTDTRRFSPDGFVKTKGHLGHMHVPGNTHGDPTTAFQGSTLLRYVKLAPNSLKVTR